MNSYVVSTNLIPDGFRYPDKYLDMAKHENFPDLAPWSFLGEVDGQLDRLYQALREDYPTRYLIPFAGWDPDDDICCFDGEDHSGDPAIHIIHMFTEPGWEERGRIENFSEWLEWAGQLSDRFRADYE